MAVATLATPVTAAPRPRAGAPARQPDAAGGGYAVFVVLFLATLLNGLDSSQFTGASAVIGRELHLGIDALGVLASAFTVCLTITIIPLGLWADRAPRVRVIAACLAVWSLATALTGLAGGFSALLITRMLTGVGEAGYLPAGTALIGDTFGEGRRGKVMSGILVGGVAGPILGMVLGGVIAGSAPGAWRLAFLGAGVPGLLLALVAWRLPEPPRASGAAAGARPQDIAAQLGALLRNGPLLGLVAIGVLTAFTSAALQTYFPILLQQRDTFGLTPAQAGTFAGLLLGPLGLGGVLLGGVLADRLRRRYRRANLILVTTSVLLTAPLNAASLVAMTTHQLPLLIAMLAPSFLINTLHFSALATAVFDVVPATERAAAVAVSAFVQRLLGTALAPVVIGMLARRFDPSGLHFAQGIAGHDLILALLCVCPLAYVAAGLVGLAMLRGYPAPRSRSG